MAGKMPERRKAGARPGLEALMTPLVTRRCHGAWKSEDSRFFFWIAELFLAQKRGLAVFYRFKSLAFILRARPQGNLGGPARGRLPAGIAAPPRQPWLLCAGAACSLASRW